MHPKYLMTAVLMAAVATTAEAVDGEALPDRLRDDDWQAPTDCAPEIGVHEKMVRNDLIAKGRQKFNPPKSLNQRRNVPTQHHRPRGRGR